MSLNNPIPGGMNASEFMVSPVPFVTSSTATGIVSHGFRDTSLSGSAADMTYVSRWVRVTNRSAAALGIAFTRRGFSTGNFFTIIQNEVFDAELRLSEVYLSGSGNSYSVVAGLTGISNRQLPVLTASNGFPGVG